MAVAILAILLQVLGLVDIFGIKEPQKESVKALIEQQNTPAQIKIIGGVTFKKGESINRISMAESTRSLTSDQICLSLGSFKTNTDFEKTTNTITYKGTASKKLDLVVICDAENNFMEHIQADYKKYVEFASDCDFDAKKDETACMVALKAG